LSQTLCYSAEYALQVFASKNLRTAETEKVSFENIYPNQNFTLITRSSDDYPFKIVTGNYEYYAEAISIKNEDFEGLDYFIVSYPELSATKKLKSEALPTFQSASKKVFDLSGFNKNSYSRQSPSIFDNESVPKPVQRILDKPVGNLNRDELLRVGIHASTNSIGIPALERFIQEHSTDPKLHDSCIALARRYMGRKDFVRVNQLITAVEADGNEAQKQKVRLLRAYSTLYQDSPEKAFQEFCDLASDSSLPENIRMDAMKRAAASIHTANNRYKALLAYNDIEETATSQYDIAEARINKLGIMLELARNGKGPFSEIVEYATLISENSSVPDNFRMKALMMAAEAHMDDGKYNHALPLVESGLSISEDTSDERNILLMIKAICYGKSGNYTASKEILNEIVNAPEEGKYADSIQARAGTWLLFFSKQYNDELTENQVKTKFESNWKSTSAYERLKNAGRI